MIDRLHWDVALAPVEEELRRAFVLRRRFRDKARDLLRQVADDYRMRTTKKVAKKGRKATNSRSKTIDIIFVGIHLRQGGHAQ